MTNDKGDGGRSVGNSPEMLRDFHRSTSVSFAGLLERPLPARTFLNVNVPQGDVKGVRVTVQARRNHITKVDRRLDPRKRPYFWIEEAQDDWEPHDRSDRQAVHDGYISVTPLQPDLTDHGALAIVEALTRGVGSAPRK